jgi:hypothetical protein
MKTKRKAKRRPVVVHGKPASNISDQRGFGNEMPPNLNLVEIYFDQKGHGKQAVPFYEFYQHIDWCTAKGHPYKNWKILASDWIFEYEQTIKLRKRLQANAL